MVSTNVSEPLLKNVSLMLSESIHKRYHSCLMSPTSVKYRNGINEPLCCIVSEMKNESKLLRVP